MKDLFEIPSIAHIGDYQPAFQWLKNRIDQYPVVLLYGTLGAGKTTFIQAFCEQYFDISDASSPTYAIINMYHGSTEVAHADLYRLDTTEELIEIGFEDLLDRKIPTFIEWPELALPLIDDHIEVYLTAKRGNNRTLKARVVRH